MKRVLQHAFNTSPYYHDEWTKIGFNPRLMKSSEEMQELSCLTKEVIEENKERMVSGLWRKEDLEVSYTGGSSGTPTSFFRDRKCTSQRMGRQWGILKLCGYKPGDRCGLIWGVHQDLSDPGVRLGLKRRLRQFASAKEARR